MATITAALVKELRERTGVGMMECKKALVSTEGDIEKAIEEMRKSGIAKAAKKSGRIAAEGIIRIASDANNAAMTEVNCETDFVARDASFIDFAQQVTQTALAQSIDSVDALTAASLGDTSIDETRQALVAKIGENINVRRVAAVATNGVIGSYAHGDKIGVLVTLNGGDESVAKDVAMHIAASRPLVIKPEDMPEDSVEKEKEIFIAQAKESGKPDNIVEKMIGGRIKKFLNENSLHGQAFIKDPDMTVGKFLAQHNAEVETFIRFEVGEGIEKQEDNFAAEVMEQVKASN